MDKAKPKYVIRSFWSSNNRPDNVVVNIPKEYVLAHKFLECRYIKIINLENGVLIQPLREMVVDAN